MSEIACGLKKRPGKLVVGSEEVQWIPTQQGDKEIIKLIDIQGMQATPPTAARLRIKLTSKDGKSILLELENVQLLETARNELQSAIKRYREGIATDTSPAVPTSQQTGTTAAQNTTTTPAAPKPKPQEGVKRTKTSSKSAKRISLEPARLLTNLELQQQLLRNNPALMKTFQQTVILTGALTNEQFWSLRMDLLITAGQQESQTVGSYNVLSTIKPTTSSDNQVNINLSREKIADLFDQYPLIRKAYNENVPKLSEGEFWQRFFMSKLFLVLRGERVLQNHPPDAVFDRYVEILKVLRQKQHEKQSTEDTKHPAPLFINIETNAENNPETYGNNLITTGGANSRNLIKSMNGLSYRLLQGKRRERDEDFMNENGDKKMENELKLHDLAPDSHKNRHMELKVSLTAETRDELETAEDAEKLYLAAPESMDLSLVGIDTAGLQIADSCIDELTPHMLSTTVSSAETSSVMDDQMLTYATTIEFLRQFWHSYQNNKSEAASLKPFLEKSLDRMAAVQKGSSLESLTASVHRALEMPL
ncbi:TFIIH/NER complex subunit [Starmerella bacillaris]|uniref:TFIIH/NER complex subunit n=1 Tax=Starmerella bacillaris TaxID=1247836 RepID=A0AAV5RHB0_STABA|nr:TFIIH/NER complex subunit [Starmerella bacillaris]